MADTGSLTAAARALNRTQPAVSKALQELESQVGVRLFDRYSHGTVPTPHGRVLIARLREAEAQFELAAREHAAEVRRTRQSRNPALSLHIGRQRLRAFLAVHEAQDITRAAQALGLSRAAIYDSLRAVEQLLDLQLFESSIAGLRSTAYADALASRISLAFSLIRHGLDEVASLDGATRGRLVIGTLPYSRTVIVPRAIDRVLRAHPALTIHTREGPYDVLERALRNGTVDLIVGAVREHMRGSLLRAESLFEDELAVICGRQHPLSGRPATIEQLLSFPWVLPVPTTPARQLFDRFLERHDAEEPGRVVETGSLSAARGLLLEGEWIALLSTHPIQPDLDAGLLTVLPVALEGTTRAIGMTFRANTTPSPATRVFASELRGIAAEISRPTTAQP